MAYIDLTQKIPTPDGWITHPLRVNDRFIKDYAPIKDDPTGGSALTVVGPRNTLASALKGFGGTHHIPVMLVAESTDEITRKIREQHGR